MISQELFSQIGQPESAETTSPFTVYIPDASDFALAQQIASWTNAPGVSMLPKTPEQIHSFFEAGNSVVLLNEFGEVVSHSAGTYIYQDGSIELGSVFTASEHRGKGAATYAIKETIKLLNAKYPGQLVFALANQYSAPIFEKLGATVMEYSALSAEVWEPCATCPNVKNNGAIFHCCDTPYLLYSNNP